MTDTGAVSLVPSSRRLWRRRLSSSLLGHLLLIGVLPTGVLLGACRREAQKGEPAPVTAPSTPSPNARILPSPLASTRGAAKDPSRDRRGATPIDPAAPVTVPLPPRPFPTSEQLVAEGYPARDGGLVELRGEFAWPELEARTVPVLGGADAMGMDGTTRERTLATRPALRLLGSPLGHLSIELVSPTFSLPAGTQLRARADRYGHVVVWPDQRSYRVAPRGSLRALLNERRADVAPLLAGQLEEEVAGRKLGLTTVRRTVDGPMGRLTLESASMPAAGSSGVLVCRFLLELARLRASSELCAPGEVPVEAHYAWARGGELSFRVDSLQRHPVWPIGVPPESFDIPPRMPIFKPGELPPEPSPFLWERETLAGLWGAESAGSELVLTNPGDVPMYVIVERLPLARVPPLSTARWVAPRPALNVSFRDFLGENVYGARRVDASAELSLGPTPPPPEPVAEVEPAGLER